MHYRNNGDMDGPLSGRELNSHVMQCTTALRKEGVNLPKAIVMRGISGMAVGFPLAAQYGCPYVVQRKDGEQCHSGPVVGTVPDGNGGVVVIVDDFVSSGDTLITMIQTLRGGSPNRGRRPWGGRILVLLYQDLDQGDCLLEMMEKKCTGVSRCVKVLGLDRPTGDAA